MLLCIPLDVWLAFEFWPTFQLEICTLSENKYRPAVTPDVNLYVNENATALNTSDVFSL